MAHRKKNATGRGTVYQDDNGKWHAWFSPGNGARRIHREAKTEAEVLVKLRELEQHKATGVTLGRSPTVTQYLKTWLELTVKQEVQRGTWLDYMDDCRRYVQPYVGRIRLDQLTPNHIRQMLADMLEKGLSPYTAKKGYQRLRSALDAAVSDRLITHNPIIFGKVKPPRVADMEEVIHALTHGQVRTLLTAVSGHRQYALYVVAVRTGMRQGELLGLRWVDVKWDAREIHVTGQMRYTRKTETEPSTLARKKTKTLKSKRVIPIGPWLLSVLRSHQENQQQERALQTDKGQWKETGLVFVSEYGTPVSASNLGRHFDALLKRAELPDIRFHDLRHTFASLALADGEPLPDVSAILGHADMATTARIYAHSYHEGQRTTMERMEARQQQREEIR